MPSRLADSYQAAVAAVRARLFEFTEARFRAEQLRDADMELFVRQVVPVVLAGRRQMSALTDGYLAAEMTDLLGHRVPPKGVVDTDLIRGVPAVEVYQRPYKTARAAIGGGASLEEATGQGVERLLSLVAADLQLAKTLTARNAIAGVSGIGGYQRVLVGSGNCGLCVVASTQRYTTSELMPIHPGCNCDVAPLKAGDRAQMRADLAGAHAAIEERFGASDPGARAPDYRKALLVRQHGELGPILTVKSHRFTGPDDLAA